MRRDLSYTSKSQLGIFKYTLGPDTGIQVSANCSSIVSCCATLPCRVGILRVQRSTTAFSLVLTVFTSLDHLNFKFCVVRYLGRGSKLDPYFSIWTR